MSHFMVPEIRANVVSDALSVGNLLHIFSSCVGDREDPKFGDLANDPRVPAMMHILSALGVERMEGGQLAFNPKKAAEFLALMDEGIDETQIVKALATGRRRGNVTVLPHFLELAIKRLPARAMVVAERRLDFERGPITIPMTKWEIYHSDDKKTQNRGLRFVTSDDEQHILNLYEPDDEGCPSEKPEMLPSPAPMLLTDGTSSNTLVPAFLSAKGAIQNVEGCYGLPVLTSVKVANEIVMVRQPRPLDEVCQRIAQMTPKELAQIAGLYAVIEDTKMQAFEAKALADLERKGLISDRGEGKEYGYNLGGAIHADIKAGRVSVQDFDGSLQRMLVEAVGGKLYLGDREFLDMLERNLFGQESALDERSDQARALPSPEPFGE